VTNVRSLAVLLPLGICALATTTHADPVDPVYTLYRDSWVSRQRRIHVATFDAARSPSIAPAFNADACNRIAQVLNQQPGSVSKYWCELGRYRPDVAARKPSGAAGVHPERRQQTSIACGSAVASRTSTPEELATACRGWTPLQIARAEVRFLSGMCKADSASDCERLCSAAPSDLPTRERAQVTSWACRRYSEISPTLP
jgi:hypothetical protein